MFQNVPGSEHVASQLLASLPPHAESAVDEASNEDASPLKTWRASTIPDAIRALLDGKALDIYDNPGVANTSWSLPPTSGSANINIERHDVHAPSIPSASTFSSNIERHDVNAPGLPTPSTSVPAPSISLAPGHSDLPDLPHDWQNLVQVYLCTEYCCLPIFEKSCPYRWAYKYQEHSSNDMCNLESSYRGQYASLWAILVLGELHLYGAQSSRMSQLKQTAKTFLATVESRGPASTYLYAYLIWAIVYTGSQSFTLARMMLAQAMVLADTPKERANGPVDEFDALVHNACFVMETVLAVATGSQTSPTIVDADSFHSGDVGEWDPFINILHQGQELAASGASSQLPPSRTGSTFTALVKLMMILRQTSHPCSDPGLLAAELRGWETSLVADLRAALTAQGRSAHSQVPSQLYLQSWYAIVCCTIAGLRQGFTGSTGIQAFSDPTTQVVEALHDIEQTHGLGMLPATSSVLIMRVAQLSGALFSHPDNAPAAHSQFVAAFSNRWAWPEVDSGVQSELAAFGIPGTQAGTHQPVHRPPPVVEATSAITLFDHQELGYGHSRYSAPTAETTVPHALSANEYAVDIHQISQQGTFIQLPTAVADDAIAADISSSLQAPASYDLLEYLTMFENNNGYVNMNRCSSSEGVIFTR